MGKEKLASDTPLANPPEMGGGAFSETYKTTYLSSGLWIVRNQEETRYMVFRRTDAQPVMDQLDRKGMPKGLVADGQLKPPDDDFVRYGKLLFAEESSDYEGWDDQ